MNRIGLATPSFNTEQWIYPFLKLTEGLFDRRVIVQGIEPLKMHVQEHGVYSTPDRSEEMIRTFFPDVEVIYQEKAEFGPQFWQQGHDHLKDDCDFILRFDTDEMLLPKDWKRLVDWLRELEDLDSLGIDFGKSIQYTYDLDHGIPNPEEYWIETRGLNKKHKYEGYGYYYGGQIVFDVQVHHFTGFKRKDMDYNFTLEDREWIKCPDEIRQLFIEGWDKLKTL